MSSSHSASSTSASSATKSATTTSTHAPTTTTTSTHSTTSTSSTSNGVSTLTPSTSPSTSSTHKSSPTASPTSTHAVTNPTPVGAIAGGIVAAIAVLFLLAGLVFFFWRRRRNARRRNSGWIQPADVVHNEPSDHESKAGLLGAAAGLFGRKSKDRSSRNSYNSMTPLNADAKSATSRIHEPVDQDPVPQLDSTAVTPEMAHSWHAQHTPRTRTPSPDPVGQVAELSSRRGSEQDQPSPPREQRHHYSPPQTFSPHHGTRQDELFLEPSSTAQRAPSPYSQPPEVQVTSPQDQPGIRDSYVRAAVMDGDTDGRRGHVMSWMRWEDSDAARRASGARGTL